MTNESKTPRAPSTPHCWPWRFSRENAPEYKSKLKASRIKQANKIANAILPLEC